MRNKRIIIIGAGLSGLSAAWHIQRKKGLDCLIFERDPEVGGLSRSKNIDGFTFDYSGHLLHLNHSYSAKFIRGLLGRNLSEHKRSAWIYSYRRYTAYPFQVNLYGMPSSIIKECLLEFILARRDARPECACKKLNFLEWIARTFGRGIAKHFMLPYNAKFWTVPLKELTCDWIDGFIPVPSLRHIVEGTVEESKRQFGYNARFWYPEDGGINEVCLSLARQVKNINLNCPVTRIDLKRKEIKAGSGRQEKFDYLISTMPLPELSCVVKGLPEQISAVFKKLRWNSIFNLNLGLNRNDTLKRHWVYFPEQDFCFFRVGFPHNFSSSLVPRGKSSLYAEVSYSKDKPINRVNIIARIKKDLERAGFLRRGEGICCEDVNDIKYGYPVYDHNYRQARGRILEYLRGRGVLGCGRYGSWRYFSMEDALIDGRRVAERIKKH